MGTFGNATVFSCSDTVILIQFVRPLGLIHLH
jgi:hypothetical protein